jgi:hypothetical protein
MGDHRLPAVVSVVIDALDECDRQDDATAIIRLLARAKEVTSVRLRFFVTSRPELPIRLGFQDVGDGYEDLALHEVPEPIIEQDITAFLEFKLDQIRRDYNKSVRPYQQLPDPWPDPASIQELVKLAIPLFIFAATACRFINDRRIGNPKGQLTKFLEYQSSSGSDLDATYRPVLDQLLGGLSESQKHIVVERFKKVVGSIVVLASPLSTASLARLLAVSIEEVHVQLGLLHSVLKIPESPDDPVRLFHLSFRDFLVDSEKRKDEEKYRFWVDKQETHERLATQCLGLLSSALREDM